ncbi:MAG: metal-dependent transcriptional regulator [Sphingobacteriales bacterium]|nr:MAG: metal-dependent transcriptional regulator [Sphingobacteriales bacterium]
MLSPTEENYLKCIYKLQQQSQGGVNTNAIAASINTAAASVTDMLKRLTEKGLLDYLRYKGVSLTEKGEELAMILVRKHRLWEVFLVEKLKMKWDEVHDIAEQLEHIQSPLLVQRLDEFLSFPKFDPHGDPIPDQFGNFSPRKEQILSDLAVGDCVNIIGVRNHEASFLQYLEKQQLTLGSHICVLEKIPFDNSLVLQRKSGETLQISNIVAENLLVSIEV